MQQIRQIEASTLIGHPNQSKKNKTEGLQNEKKKGIEKAVQPNGIQGASAPLDRVEPKKGIEKAVQPNGMQGASAPLDRVEPKKGMEKAGDPNGNRTRVTAVKGQCPNR